MCGCGCNGKCSDTANVRLPGRMKTAKTVDQEQTVLGNLGSVTMRFDRNDLMYAGAVWVLSSLVSSAIIKAAS